MASTFVNDDLFSHFVLHDTEVKLTGRVAGRAIGANKSQELVEVTPSEEENGTWKKWVPKSSLFKINTIANPLLTE
jgi:hypothetical protein